MEPSSTEGGAEETLLKNNPSSPVSAEIKSVYSPGLPLN